MSSLNNFLNAAGNDYVRIALIFALVLIAVFILFYFIRLILRSMKRGVLSGRRSRQPRLGFVDEAEVDSQRRLILIRRDNVEHLILLGPTHDLVVESNIMRAFDGQKVAPSPQREIYPDEENKAYVPTAKNAARKAAGEVSPPAQRAPVPQAKLTLDTPPPQEPPVPLKQEPAPAPLASRPISLERPNLSQARFTPIPTASKQPEPLSAPKAFEQEIITLNPIASPKKVTFDSLEDEMAALLGQKKS